jgi:ankyrin repeat protein
LLEYEKNLLDKVENDAYIPCMCRCDICTCDTSSTSSPSQLVDQLNKKNYDPLMMAIASRNHKCVEELILVSEAYSKKININLRDILGNTCLHLCAQANNVESLNYLLNKYFVNDTSILKAKNLQDETVLHVACRYGNLEIIKILLNRIYESDLPNESILLAQDKDGETCFAIACAKGFLNVVEFFLKDKKLKSFLEFVDNNSNTCLHVATYNGHFSIAQILLDNGVNVTAVNEKNLSALDISCRKGFFEISKILISYYATMDECESPLQTACYEGIYFN